MDIERQADELMHLIETLPEQDFAMGDVVIAEGASTGGLYFLVEGTVDVTKDGIRVASIDRAGAVFGEMSLLLDCPATATVTARSNCTFKVAERRADFLREKFPEAALYVATVLAHRLDSLTRYLVDIKRQFSDRSDHLAMMDEILEGIMAKHPRLIPRDSGREEEFDED